MTKFLWLVKSWRNSIVNNTIVHHLEKCDLFFTVVSDGIAWNFNASGVTRAIALDISKALDRVLMEFQVGYLALFPLFSVIDGFEWFWMESLHKAPFLAQHFSYYYINELLDDIICDIGIYPDDTNLCSKCDQVSDLWQFIELSEFESDLRDTVYWGRKWLVDFNTGKTQLVLFDRSNSIGAIDGSVHEEKSSCKMLELTFPSKFPSLTLSLLLELPL